MTWRELIERIPEDKLDTKVIIYDNIDCSDVKMHTFGWDEASINDGGFYIVF